MPTTLSARESMGTIDKFIREVGAAEKRATDKSAEEPLSEPGSQGGETSHPVKSVDDRLQAAEEGERSAENEADVKNDQGKPGVNSTPEASSEGTKKAGFFDLSRFAKPIPGRVKRADEGKSSGGAVQTPGSASDDHLQIGTKKEPTGEDPSVETNSAKAGKEDPGSSHPARTDNDQLDGHKYAAERLDSMSLENLAKVASDLGNDLCAALATDEEPAPKQAADNRADADLAHQAGWELAGLATGEFDKHAADAMVQNTLEEVIKTASDDADRVAHYMDEFYAAKQAEAGMPADPSMMPPPPGGGMPMGDEGGGDPLAGAGGAGGAGGGDDMLSALGGGEPPMDAGAGGAGGAGGIDPQVLELAQVLSELGVTAQELEQAMAGGGGEGGMPEGAEPGGEGHEEPDADDAGMPPPKQAAAKRGNAREAAQQVIQEIITRSRRR